MTTTTRLQKAVAVLRGLESDLNTVKGPNSPFKVYGLLAGGCARDVHFGIEPKDWDIVFGRDVSLSQIEYSLAENGITDYRILPFYKEGTRDRIKFCVKFTFEGEDYDVLVYDVPITRDAIPEFDFNLNQFAIGGNSLPIYLGSTDLSYGLVAIRGDHSLERGLKMEEKYASLKAAGKL